MQKSDLNYLHRKTLDELKAAILNGTLVPGERFYSRAELCRKFRITANMAHRIQTELQALNLLLPQCGSKFIVTMARKSASAAVRKLKKVLFIGDANAICDDSYGGMIVRGVREACQEHGLEFEREFVSVLNKPANYINIRRTVDADTGVILMMNMDLGREVITLLLDNNVPLVTANSFFPQRSAVLPDFRLAARQLLEEAAARGAKKVMYCSGFELVPCPIIAEEREKSFTEYSMFLCLEHLIANSGNFHQLCRKAVNFKPDAMLFLNDSWARHFKTHYLSKIGISPRILGCDNYAGKDDVCDFTTWDTNPVLQGRTAVDVLLDPLANVKPYVTRIKGKLIIRD